MPPSIVYSFPAALRTQIRRHASTRLMREYEVNEDAEKSSALDEYLVSIRWIDGPHHPSSYYRRLPLTTPLGCDGR